jgi:hypothetical protein
VKCCKEIKGLCFLNWKAPRAADNIAAAAADTVGRDGDTFVIQYSSLNCSSYTAWNKKGR